MSEMIEKVARAICVGDPDHMMNETVFHRHPGGAISATPTGPLLPAWQHSRNLKKARDAIAAMREPTEAIVAEASGVVGYHPGLAKETARLVWRAMIDAALESVEAA